MEIGNVEEQGRLYVQKGSWGKANEKGKKLGTRQIKGSKKLKEFKRTSGRFFFANINHHSSGCSLHSNSSQLCHLCQQYVLEGTKSLWNGRHDRKERKGCGSENTLHLGHRMLFNLCSRNTHVFP